MTLPSTLPSGTQFNGQSGARASGKQLWRASDGDIYFIGIIDGGGAADEVGMYRSTDGGNTWDSAVETDREGDGPPFEDTISVVSADADGDTLYVAWQEIEAQAGMDVQTIVGFQVFDMDANTWTGSSEEVAAPGNTIGLVRLDVARRTSDVVVIYGHTLHRDMGQDYASVGLARGNAGSWTVVGQIDPDDAFDYFAEGCVVGSQAGEAHLIFGTDIEADGVMLAQTIDGSNSLSTIVSQTTSLSGYRRGSPAVAFQRSGGGWAITLLVENQSTTVLVYNWTEDGSDDIAVDTQNSVEPDQVNDPKTLVWSDLDHDMYAFWSPVDDDDIDYEIKDDGAASSWLGTVVASWQTENMFSGGGMVGIELTHSSGNGGDTVIAVVWENNSGDVMYDEIVIATGAPPAVYPPFPPHKRPHVRM